MYNLKALVGITAAVVTLCAVNASLGPVVYAEEAPMLAAPVIEASEPHEDTVEVIPAVDLVPAAPRFDPRDLEQLAIVIYRETGGDKVCDECRRRVADVVLNRVADPRFPDTLEGVLTQKRQYGTMYWDGVVWPERASESVEAGAVDRAYRIAEEVLTGHHSALYGNGYVFQSEFPDLGEDDGRVECDGIYFAKG